MLKKHITDNVYQWATHLSAPPTQISISPTNSCNLKCQSCWQRDQAYQSLKASQKPVEMSDQRLLGLIDEAGKLGVKCIEITGAGEPLVRRNTFIKLVKAIKKSGMIGWLTTNGTLFSEAMVKLMVELGWDKVTISLDGPDAQTNDFLRPPQGTFSKIMKTLLLFNEYKKRLAKISPAITFNVVVSRYNAWKLSEIITLAGNCGVEGVTFEPIKILARQCNELLFDFEKDCHALNTQFEKAHKASLEKNVFTNIEELLRSPELIRDSGRLISTMGASNQGRTNDLLDALCLEPWFHMYVEVDGAVRPCCVSPGLGENINEKSLKDIWFGERFSQFRESILHKNYPSSCNQCNANLICFSRELQVILRKKLLRKHDNPTEESGSFDNNLKQNSLRRQFKVVVADTAPLYPPLWGGPRRIWNLFGNFAQDLFDFTYVGVTFEGPRDARYKQQRIRGNFKESLCVFPPHYYLWHIFERALLNNTSLDLFLYLAMNTDWQFKYLLNSQDADIIVCSHPWASPCIQKKEGQFFIYDAHNCEYFLMAKILERRILKGPVLGKVKKIEGDACAKSDLILVCSEKEKSDFVDLYKVDPDKVMIATNGAEVKEATSLSEKDSCRGALGLSREGKVVIFVGAYYKPNIDAARFVIKNIAPAMPGVIFLLIGTIADAFVAGALPSNVKLLGRVSEEKLETALRASDIAINPMFNGSGTNIKMLDYMAYGLPIVTTQTGARGIETFGRQPMVIIPAEEFCAAIQKLLSEEELARRLAQEGRYLIAKHYDWKIISSRLQDAILEGLK